MLDSAFREGLNMSSAAGDVSNLVIRWRLLESLEEEQDRLCRALCSLSL
jgi:hypothetical protein